MNRRTASAGSGADYCNIHTLVTGIAGRCTTPGWSCRAINGLIRGTGNRRSCNITHGDRCAAGCSVTTVICCTEYAGMNGRTASTWCSAYYHYIHTLVTGIAGRCITKYHRGRTVDSLVGRTGYDWSCYIANSDRSAAGCSVTTVICCTEDTGMNVGQLPLGVVLTTTTSTLWSQASLAVAYPRWSCRTIDSLVRRTGDRRSGNITHGDRCAASACVTTVIRCTEDAGMNRRTASACCSAYYHYLHALVTGIAGRCATPNWSSRTIDGLVRRTSDRRSGNITYGDRSAAG
jgi:hypothetical protein